LDRNHIKVQIPPGYLAKSGAVGFSNYANRPEPELGSNVEAPQQILYVASKDSPVLSSVYPSEVSPDEVENGSFHVPFVLYGSGFTPASRVIRSLYHVDLGYQGTTRFISPNEIHYEMYKDEFVIDHKWSAISPIQLWVANDDWLHVSEPQEIRIDPSPSFPANPATAERAKITSVSPYPVPLIDPAGPTFLMVTVQGEHFQPRQSVVAMIHTNGQDQEVKLKTQYISPLQLHAWLPRSAWSEHKLRYRFGVGTAKGTCAVEAAEEDDN
jgi:hypothetical protein